MSTTMNKPWLGAYPPGTPAEIDADSLQSLVEVLEDNPAYRAGPETPMKTYRSNPRARHVMASVLMLMGANAALPANPPAASPPTASTAAPSKEMREKMASLHEQMAACLRSDKPIADCHSQMMKSCQDAMGERGCRMMGHGMMGDGSGKHDHMIHDTTKNPEDHK